MTRTPAALMAFPLAASMLMSGCGGSDNAGASGAGTSTASPSATVSPTTTAPIIATAVLTTDPNIPASARAHTIAGAEAFVRYYIDRWNVAWTVPRAGIIGPLCQASSKACTANEETATRLRRDKHRYDGNPLTIKFIGVLDATNPSKYDVLANVIQERRNEIDAAGKTVITDQRKDLRIKVELMYTGQTWSVSTMKIMQ